ncbi:MAG TPA: HlyD family secretion protein [bacterium]|nr:HlyD family secretion protein [bacterium]
MNNKPSTATAVHPQLRPGPNGQGGKPADNGKKKKILRIIGLVALVVAAYFIYQNWRYEGTDDAYVEAHALMLAPRIGGTVTQVLVKENQAVTQGQVLAQLDDQDYATAKNQALGDQDSVVAQLDQAAKDLSRIKKLFEDQAVSKADYDAAVARYGNLSSRLKADQARVAQADLNLSYTKITAPTDGTIAKKSVEPGMVVPQGQALFGFVSSKERWVEANFKETQLSRIKPGQKVDVEVDAIPGRTFQGVVDSIGSATGSTFTLLPPDNSTGNFTKVVQRVPVKIDLPNLTPEDIGRLAAGLSAVVNVKVH